MCRRRMLDCDMWTVLQPRDGETLWCGLLGTIRTNIDVRRTIRRTHVEAFIPDSAFGGTSTCPEKDILVLFWMKKCPISGRLLNSDKMSRLHTDALRRATQTDDTISFPLARFVSQHQCWRAFLSPICCVPKSKKQIAIALGLPSWTTKRWWQWLPSFVSCVRIHCANCSAFMELGCQFLLILGNAPSHACKLACGHNKKVLDGTVESTKRTQDRENTTTPLHGLTFPSQMVVTDPQRCRGAPPSLLKQTKTASLFFFLLAIVSLMTENTIFHNERRVLKALVNFGEVHFS